MKRQAKKGYDRGKVVQCEVCHWKGKKKTVLRAGTSGYCPGCKNVKLV
ncbi:hypothetical protein K9M79_05645 [Candidatus Woesearchaeota archaeon]|nr:hypothetical protein [Candidatus Woesearchaeota archaeon]